MKGNLNEVRIRNIYIMLIAILCMTIISTAAILTYVMVHIDDNKAKINNNITSNSTYDVSSFEQINVEKFIELFNSDKQSLIYVGRPSCSHCLSFLPVLKQAQEDYGYTTYYFDLDSISKNDSDKITKLDPYLENNFGTTPMVIVVKNSKLISSGDDKGWLGESTYKEFSKYLEKIGYERK